jgi:hypothetical protein
MALHPSNPTPTMSQRIERFVDEALEGLDMARFHHGLEREWAKRAPPNAALHQLFANGWNERGSFLNSITSAGTQPACPPPSLQPSPIVHAMQSVSSLQSNPPNPHSLIVVQCGQGWWCGVERIGLDLAARCHRSCPRPLVVRWHGRHSQAM